MPILEKFNYYLNRNPKKKAVISKHMSLTYRDVDNVSNYLAGKLLGVSKKEIVPFYLNNTLYVLPVVLGIIKSGKIPLPITNSLSAEKSLERISDIDYDILIIDNETDFLKKNIKYIIVRSDYINTDKINVIGNRNIYIICTSGTTGIPKKVFLTENNLDWLLETFYEIVDFSEESCFLFTTPYTFDVSLTEIFAPVYRGGTLICYDGGINDMCNMKRILEENKITHLSLSPSFAETLVEVNNISAFESLKAICIAGEMFPAALANRMRKIISNGSRVFNFYGPSETTIYATYYELQDMEYNVVPIGKPLPGVEIKVVYDEMYEMGNGVGELYIGGSGVSDGYKLNPELYSEKFVKFNENKFYKTGDFVYYKGSELVFESRKDSQVQINGIRVELDEVKSIVDALEEIQSSRVAFYKKKLYIFYISNKDMKSEILENLPTYISPTIIKVSEYFLNQSRKLDVDKMLKRFYFEDTYMSNNKVEKKIADILLKFGSMHLTDLDSLDLVKFFIEIEDTFNIKIKDDDTYKLKDIESITDYVSCNKKYYKENKQNTQNKCDAINLEYCLSKQNTNANPEIIMATPTQLRLYKKGQYRTIYFDLNLKNVSNNEILKLEFVFKNLSEKIDLLRMVINKFDKKIEFRLLENVSYNPNIIILNELPNESILQEKLEKMDKIQIPVIVISVEQKKARVYFPYHSIDASSINKLEKIIFECYENEKNIRFVHESSLQEFEKYKEKKAHIGLTTDILEKIPIMKDIIDFNRIREGTQVYKVNMRGNDTKSDVYLYSVYLICRCILCEYELENISGGLSYDYRNYKEFNSKDLIGDIHKKVPFEIKKNDKFENFIINFSNLLNIYSEGIDFYDISIRRRDIEGNYVREAIKKICLSINYLGEVLDVDNKINQLKSNQFEKNFINIFTHKEQCYYVLGSHLLNTNNYIVDGKKIQQVKMGKKGMEPYEG